jgi:tetratricopeptide (TPR) repeat protein
MFIKILKAAKPYLHSPVAHIAILIVITAGIYAPSLGHDFVWDDRLIVTPINAYFDFDIQKILSQPVNGYEYLPVRDISLALDALIWGKNPFGFHLTNLLLYLITIVVCYYATLALARLYDNQSSYVIAFATSLIFAIHPLHAEPVNWITGRNNILSFLFILISTLFFLKSHDGKAKYLLFSLAAFVLAGFSKASAIYYPAIPVILTIITPALNKHERSTYIYLATIAAIDLLIIRTHFLTAKSLSVVDENLWRFGTHDLTHNLTKALYIPIHYLYKMVQPYPLSIAYPDTDFNSLGAPELAFFALCISGGIAIAWFFRKHRVILTIGITWFLASLVPSLNIFPTNPVIADRYTYHAVYGFALITSSLLAYKASSKMWAKAVAGAVLILWAGVTFTRGFDWQSDTKLFRSAYEAYPDTAAYAYATTLFNYGQYNEAMTVLKTRGSNKFGEITFLQGRYLYETGEYDQALRNFIEVENSGFKDILLLSPYLGYRKPHYEIQAKEGIRRIKAAMQPALARAMTAADTNKKDLQLQADAALLLMRTNEYLEAIPYLERAAALDRNVWQVWYNLGLCNLAKALEAFEQVLALNSQNLDGLNQAGIVTARNGNYRQAISYYQRAISINPNHLDASYNLARVYFQLGELDNAKAALLRAHNIATSPIMKSRIREILKKPPLNYKF